MEKIKQFINETMLSEKGKDILVVLIVILVGLGSFELGRLSKDNSSSGIKIEYPDQNSSQPGSAISAVEYLNILQNDKMSITGNLNPSSKAFFASNKGTKYYSIGCSAGKSIKQENRVYFMTKEEAERAGYELSSSCN